MLEKYLEISEEVKNALKNNKPVIALESTIISHGMPYPQNAETALKRILRRLLCCMPLQSYGYQGNGCRQILV